MIPALGIDDVYCRIDLLVLYDLSFSYACPFISQYKCLFTVYVNHRQYLSTDLTCKIVGNRYVLRLPIFRIALIIEYQDIVAILWYSFNLIGYEVDHGT